MTNFKFEPCFVTDFFTIEKKEMSSEKPYYRYNTNSSVISVVLDLEDNLVFVRQFRENLEDYTLEFPAGGIENDESSLAAIAREVFEESGIQVKVKYLGEGYLLMDRCKNLDQLFFVFVDVNKKKRFNSNVKSEFPVIKIKRLEFIDYLKKSEFKQLGALSIITLIDYKFGVQFLKDPRSSLIEKGLLL